MELVRNRCRKVRSVRLRYRSTHYWLFIAGLMEIAPVKHAWQEWQKRAGLEITAVNPLELGRPFTLTESQRINLQPYIEHAGEGGAVLIVCTYSAYENWLSARPLALTADQRKSISGSLTRLAKQPTKAK